MWAALEVVRLRSLKKCVGSPGVTPRRVARDGRENVRFLHKLERESQPNLEEPPVQRNQEMQQMKSSIIFN